MFAYSPNGSMLGAVWVEEGERLTAAAHEGFLADRLGYLLQHVDDLEDLKEWVGQHLAEAGLDVDAGEAIHDPALLVQAAEPGLRVQGALLAVAVTVDKDDPELRERLLGEVDEPDQALLSWLGNALAPLDSNRD